MDLWPTGVLLFFLTRLFLFLSIVDISMHLPQISQSETYRKRDRVSEYRLKLGTRWADWDNLGRCLYLHSFWVNGHRRPYLHCGLNVKWVLEPQILRGKVVVSWNMRRLSSSSLFLSPSLGVNRRLLSLPVICQQSMQQLFLLHRNFFDRNYSCQLPPTLASSIPWSHMGREGVSREHASPERVLWFLCAVVWEIRTYVLYSFTWIPCFAVFDYSSHSYTCLGL